MKDQLLVGKQVVMRELFNTSITDVKEKSRNMLITFLSLLELGKMEFISLYQTENYGDIYVTAKQPITEDVVSRAENYDNLNSDQVAAQMMAQSNRQTEILTMDEVEQIEKDTDFVLNDTEDQTQLAFASEELTINDDIATDEEILAAELLEEQLPSDTEGQV